MPKPHRRQATWPPRVSIPPSVALPRMAPAPTPSGSTSSVGLYANHQGIATYSDGGGCSSHINLAAGQSNAAFKSMAWCNTNNGMRLWWGGVPGSGRPSMPGGFLWVTAD